MFTPRTSVPVVGVADVMELYGSGVVCGSSSSSTTAPSAQIVTSSSLDQIASTRKSPLRSSTLMKPFVSRITLPSPSLSVPLSASTMPVNVTGPDALGWLLRWRTEMKSPAFRYGVPPVGRSPTLGAPLLS